MLGGDFRVRRPMYHQQMPVGQAARLQCQIGIVVLLHVFRGDAEVFFREVRV